MRRGTGIVLRIGNIKSERKTTPLHERRKIGNMVGLQSIMRGTMGGSEKERGTVNEREGSGMMYRGEKAGIEVSQCEGKRGFRMRELRRYPCCFFSLGSILTDCLIES
jgi:hypothetical protein